MTTHKVNWERGTVTAEVYGSGGRAVLLAHGAGTNHGHPLMVGLAEALAESGLSVVTFNYPYTEAGRRAPDRLPTLLACHRSVGVWTRKHVSPLIVMAGRSMGGRMSSMLAAEGEPMLGLVLYAYPLHPAGKPDRLRIEHLPQIDVPMLFFQGDRDALSTPDLFDRHIRSLPNADVLDLEGTDHGWRAAPTQLTGRLAQIASDTARWITRLAPDGGFRA